MRFDDLPILAKFLYQERPCMKLRPFVNHIEGRWFVWLRGRLPYGGTVMNGRYNPLPGTVDRIRGNVSVQECQP